LSKLVISIKSLKVQKERDRKIQELIEDSIEYANEIVGSGDYFEAGEFLYTAAELLEDFNNNHSNKLYKAPILVSHCSYWSLDYLINFRNSGDFE